MRLLNDHFYAREINSAISNGSCESPLNQQLSTDVREQAGRYLCGASVSVFE